MSNAEGIDVSYANQHVDWWAEEHVHHIDFAACKVFELGVGQDDQFARNWELMDKRSDGKLVRIAYIYAHPGATVAEQADVAVQIVKDHGLIEGDHFGLDLEEADGCSADEIRRFAKAFSRRVNVLADKSRCLGYTYPNFVAAYMAGMGWGWHLWISNTEVSAPAIPEPWASADTTPKGYAIWQNGTRGVDHDVFNGDKAAMLDFFRMPADRR